MLIRPDGSGLHSPTNDVPGGDQTNPDWSPDGSQLVFPVFDGTHEDLWVVNADGTGARLLADCSGECSNIVRPEPGFAYAGQRWSPDGASIVLEVLRLSAPSLTADIEDVSLAIIDVAAPTPAGRELLGSKRFPETAAWSPDGSVIVFGALREPGASSTDLFLIRPDGSGLRQITQGASATHPEVSRDGASVIFTASRPGMADSVLAQVPIGGGEITPATGTEFIAGVHPRVRPVP
jgi:Tol biopolymer transport system component